MNRMLHRLLRSAGLHIERHRDAFTDLARSCPDAELVIDGGAYKGAASKLFLTLFPRADVHAFEPNPDLAQQIGFSIDNPRFSIHGVALSDRAGETVLHIPEKAFTASLLTPEKALGATRDVPVSMTTLNAFGRQPDVLKLDLQGNELAALRGATKVLPKVQSVLCEVNFVPRYEGCAIAHDVAAFLHDYGLNLHRYYEVHTSKSGRWQFADALFVRG